MKQIITFIREIDDENEKINIKNKSNDLDVLISRYMKPHIKKVSPLFDRGQLKIVDDDDNVIAEATLSIDKKEH